MVQMNATRISEPINGKGSSLLKSVSTTACSSGARCTKDAAKLPNMTVKITVMMPVRKIQYLTAGDRRSPRLFCKIALRGADAHEVNKILGCSSVRFNQGRQLFVLLVDG